MKYSRTLLAILALYGTAQAAQLTLFKQPNFTGDKMTLHTDTTDLSGANFQDQASSVVVHSGRWQVCTQPNFQGNCAVLEPGRYASLEQNLNHRIESARQVSRYAGNDRERRDAYAERDRRDNGYDGDNGYRGDSGYTGYGGNTGYDERQYRDERWSERSQDYPSDRGYRYSR